MKKLTLLLLFPMFCFSQFQEGRYIIKQAVTNFSIKSLEYPAQYTRIEPACEDYKVNCDNQIFDIINQGGFYFIKLASKNLYLSLDGSADYNYTIRFKPKAPRALEYKQLFSIADNGNGGFYLKPKLENNANYFVGTRMDLYPNYGSELQFLIKNQNFLPREYNDFRNVSWTFFSVPKTVNLVVPTKPINTIATGNVIVSASKNVLYVDLRTGRDNLQSKGYQNNPKITIKLKNKPDMVLEDINKGETWPSNSTRRVSIPIPDGVTKGDFMEILVERSRNNKIPLTTFEKLEKDDWDLNKITVKAEIYNNGVKESIVLLDKENDNQMDRNLELYKFFYSDLRNNQGTLFQMSLRERGYQNSIAINREASASSNIIIEAVFGTGGDNLEGGNDNNVNIIIKFKSNPKIITIKNVNFRGKWNNFTEQTYLKPIENSAEFDINDVKEIEIRHTGGGGIGADNWDLDKLRITLNKSGNTRTWVDKVGTPIQRFTGDSRRLTYKF